MKYSPKKKKKKKTQEPGTKQSKNSAAWISVRVRKTCAVCIAAEFKVSVSE